MSSEVKIKVIKSPTSPVKIPDQNLAVSQYRVVYYVKTSDGLILTKPEDFPNKSKKTEEEMTYV